MVLDQEFPKPPGPNPHVTGYPIPCRIRIGQLWKPNVKTSHLTTKPSIIGDSVLAAPIQMTEYCHSRLEYCRALHIHIYIYLFIYPYYCSSHQYSLDFIRLAHPMSPTSPSDIKCPSSETSAVQNSQFNFAAQPIQLNFADRFFLISSFSHVWWPRWSVHHAFLMGKIDWPLLYYLELERP